MRNYNEGDVSIFRKNASKRIKKSLEQKEYSQNTKIISFLRLQLDEKGLLDLGIYFSSFII